MSHVATFGDPRITRFRHGAIAKIGLNEDRVPIDPVEAPFRFAPIESIGDEGLGIEVELAGDRRVRPTPG